LPEPVEAGKQERLQQLLATMIARAFAKDNPHLFHPHTLREAATNGPAHPARQSVGYALQEKTHPDDSDDLTE